MPEEVEFPRQLCFKTDHVHCVGIAVANCETCAILFIFVARSVGAAFIVQAIAGYLLLRYG
jgi:hypothetical protein